jgi:serine/threonine-protein kinase HipA
MAAEEPQGRRLRRGITASRAKEILSDVMHAVNGWHKTGQSIGMSEEELEPFTDAFEHGERAVAKRLI